MTIAKDIELEDPFENMGAQLVKEVATKTNDVAGDGTTTATLLAQAMIREGLKNVAAGANPMVIRRGIEKATEVTVEELKKLSKPVSGSKSIAQVAAICGRRTIGRRFPAPWRRLATRAFATVEVQDHEDELSLVRGMQFDLMPPLTW